MCLKLFRPTNENSKITFLVNKTLTGFSSNFIKY